jgi:hypothetical protein
MCWITVQILDVAALVVHLTHLSFLPKGVLLSVLFPPPFSSDVSALQHVPKQFHYFEFCSVLMMVYSTWDC